MDKSHETVEIPEPNMARFIFSDARFAWFWLIVRLSVAYQWITAGWEKANSPAWVGSHAGNAIAGFFASVQTKAIGQNPAVAPWYASFISHAALPHPVFFSYLITFGELAVGIGLLLGALTGIAAFFGIVMNLNYLLAGAISINPLLLILEVFLVLAWRSAGWIGADRILLPAFGTPWQPGTLFKKRNTS